MRPVTVQFLKNPDILHWGFEALYLGDDEWGDWIWVPTGTRRWKGDETFAPTRMPAVFCAPRQGWWHLHYNGNRGGRISHFVDIATPPRWVSPDRYEMIDLDLDVIHTVDGEVEIEDEDEFEVHQVRYEYTPEMIERAISETETIVAALRAGEEPFFAVADSWMRRALEISD